MVMTFNIIARCTLVLQTNYECLKRNEYRNAEFLAFVNARTYHKDCLGGGGGRQKEARARGGAGALLLGDHTHTHTHARTTITLKNNK